MVIDRDHCDTGSFAQQAPLAGAPLAQQARRIGPNPDRLSKSPTYQSWAAMKRRCTHPSEDNYRHYGGRGVRVCDRWVNSFATFLLDMGERPSKAHTLDRINPDGHYEPTNCRWATWDQQGMNRRNVTRVTVDGETRSIHGWTRAIGVSNSIIAEWQQRNGGTIEDAVRAVRARKLAREAVAS